MFRHSFHPVAVILIGLGVIGLLFSFISHPLRLLAIFAAIAAIAVLGSFLYKHFAGKAKGNMSNYKRAVKQSNKRYKNQRKPSRPAHLKVVNSKNRNPDKKAAASLQKRKKQHHLKVIDGKKGKKKNRALF